MIFMQMYKKDELDGYSMDDIEGCECAHKEIQIKKLRASGILHPADERDFDEFKKWVIKEIDLELEGDEKFEEESENTFHAMLKFRAICREFHDKMAAVQFAPYKKRKRDE